MWYMVTRNYNESFFVFYYILIVIGVLKFGGYMERKINNIFKYFHEFLKTNVWVIIFNKIYCWQFDLPKYSESCGVVTDFRYQDT